MFERVINAFLDMTQKSLVELGLGDASIYFVLLVTLMFR